jgi:hypothetical protein
MKSNIYLYATICVCLILAGCGAENPEQQTKTPRPITVWDDNHKAYYTNVVSVAQAETPFPIVLPSYLPADVIPGIYFRGRAKSEFIDDDPVEITFKRDRKEGDGGVIEESIIIEEYSEIQNFLHESDAISFTYLGTQVIEEKGSAMSMTGQGVAFSVSSHTYFWNKNGVQFVVTIISYETDEARNIIESMIK